MDPGLKACARPARLSACSLASLRCVLLIAQGWPCERYRAEDSGASPASENAGDGLLKQEARKLQISATSSR
jgi:hypothetical protein